MKNLLLLLTLAFTINANAQNEKTVTLVVSGQGKTQDEAKQKALRSAIEQAFGTFISSKTEILNDKLVKDEIVSVTNGNIEKFDVISEIQIPDGGYAITLKAIVSVSKLTSFCENQGVEVEFKGGLFAMNIRLQKLNEEAEYKAILQFCNVSKAILNRSLDFELKVNDPKSFDGGSELFTIQFDVKATSNNNLKTFQDYFKKIIAGLAMTKEDRENYTLLNKYIFPIITQNKDTFYLRNQHSIEVLKYFILKLNYNIFKFNVISNLDTININFVDGKLACKYCTDSEAEYYFFNSNIDYSTSDLFIEKKVVTSFSANNLSYPDIFGYQQRDFGGIMEYHKSSIDFYNILNNLDDKRYDNIKKRYFLADSSKINTFRDFINFKFFENSNLNRMPNSFSTYNEYHSAFNTDKRFPIFFNIKEDKDLPLIYEISLFHKIDFKKVERIDKYRIVPITNE